MYSPPWYQVSDIVLLWRDLKQIQLIELTVPFELNIESSTLRKENKYAGLLSDLGTVGYDASLIHIAIGSRGLITSQNSLQLRLCHPHSMKRKPIKLLKDKITKMAVSASYSIFHHRKDPSWVSKELLVWNE